MKMIVWSFLLTSAGFTLVQEVILVEPTITGNFINDNTLLPGLTHSVFKRDLTPLVYLSTVLLGKAFYSLFSTLDHILYFSHKSLISEVVIYNSTMGT